MAEVRSTPPNGRTVASLFSGCGGSSLGYRMAGFRVAYAGEFVEAARDTYAANAAPATVIDPRDIRDVQPGDVLAACGLAAGDLDVLDGSPPCASFSMAGRRSAGWGQVKRYSDTSQRTDDLFGEFVRLLAGVRPKAFVAENVGGLVRGVAKGYFIHIMQLLRGCGYRVRARLLDAQWLGVPQARQRLIFVGVRADLNREPVHPRPLPYRYSIRDALPWIDRYVFDNSGAVYRERDPSAEPAATIAVSKGAASGHHQVCGPAVAIGIKGGGVRSLDEPAPTVMTHNNPHTHSEMTLVVEPEADITRFAIGAEWDRMGEPGTQSDRYFQLVRPDPDAACPTITATAGQSGAAGVTHPTERRKFSIGELRRICGFPDDFVLTGSYRQQWERLGRAVPPVMMFHVARTLAQEVLCTA